MSVDHGSLRPYLNGTFVNTMTGFPEAFTPATQRQFALGNKSSALIDLERGGP
jgi:hypothetical protein